jgi:16S rRNA (guanine527-N7)-methyltransferase
VGRKSLEEWLAEGQERGLIGPRELPGALSHARGLGEIALSGYAGPKRALDIGSGGGLPGLVLAVDWPDWEWTLLDSAERSTRLLREAVEDLGLNSRVEVVTGRAEDRASEDRRGRFGLVISRSVAAPAIIAEYAAPYLTPGGRLVVSQPPDVSESAWPADDLALLGMKLRDISHNPVSAVVEQTSPAPGIYPRRTGVAAKRPLWKAPNSR